MNSFSRLLLVALFLCGSAALSAQWETERAPSDGPVVMTADGETVYLLRNETLYRRSVVEGASWSAQPVVADILATVPDGHFRSLAVKGSTLAALYTDNDLTWLLASMDGGATWSTMLLDGGVSWGDLEATDTGWLLFGYPGGPSGVAAYAPTLADDWQILDQNISTQRGFSRGPGGLYLTGLPGTGLAFSPDGGATWQPGPQLPGLDSDDPQPFSVELWGKPDRLFLYAPGMPPAPFRSLYTTADGAEWSQVPAPQMDGMPLDWNLAVAQEEGFYVLGSVVLNDGSSAAYSLVRTVDGESWETVLAAIPAEGALGQKLWNVDAFFIQDGVAYFTFPTGEAATIALDDGAVGFTTGTAVDAFLTGDQLLWQTYDAGLFLGGVDDLFLKAVPAPGVTDPRDHGFPFVWGDTFGLIGPRAVQPPFGRSLYRWEDDTWVELGPVPPTEPGFFATAGETLIVIDPTAGDFLATDDGVSWRFLDEGDSFSSMLNNPSFRLVTAGDRLLLPSARSAAIYQAGEWFSSMRWPVDDLPWRQNVSLGLAGERLVVATDNGIWHAPLVMDRFSQEDPDWAFIPFYTAIPKDVHSLGNRALVRLSNDQLLQLDSGGDWAEVPAPNARLYRTRFAASGGDVVALGDHRVARAASLSALRTFDDTAVSLGEGWYRDEGMIITYYVAPDSNWVYLLDGWSRDPFGWVWWDRTQELNAAWLYDPQLGWLFTNSALWRTFWRAEDNQRWYLADAEETSRTFRVLAGDAELVLPR